MTAEDLAVFLKRDFPQVGDDFEFVEVTEDHVIMALSASEKHLRPGGTVSGPDTTDAWGSGSIILFLSLIFCKRNRPNPARP